LTKEKKNGNIFIEIIKKKTINLDRQWTLIPKQNKIDITIEPGTVESNRFSSLSFKYVHYTSCILLQKRT